MKHSGRLPSLAIATTVVAIAIGVGLLLWALTRTNGDDRSPASSICVPGQAANLFVDVQDAGPESFAGPASSTNNKPLGETVLVRVFQNTHWNGNIQSMTDVQNGMEAGIGITLQATGPYQSNCSLLAANVYSGGIAAATAGATATVVGPTPGIPIGQTTVLATGNAGGMDWSPDGQSLAYSLDGRLYRADSPDFSPRLLATPTDELLSIYTPRWSPDGTKVAFTASHPGRSGNPDDSTGTIGLVNSDGTGLRDLLPGSAADLAPSSSKAIGYWLDDQNVVFYQHCGTACNLPYVVNTQTGNLRRAVEFLDKDTGLLGGGILGTVYYWSPDKRWIAAAQFEGNRALVLYDRHNRTIMDVTTPPPGFDKPWASFARPYPAHHDSRLLTRHCAVPPYAWSYFPTCRSIAPHVPTRMGAWQCARSERD